MSREGIAVARDLAGIFAEEFAGAVEAMAEFRPETEILASEPEPSPGVSWWRQPFDAFPDASLWAGFPEETWFAVGAAILAAAGLETEDKEECKSTCLEGLKQALGSVARALTAKAGREVSCVEGAWEESRPAGVPVAVSLRMKDQDLPPFLLVFSPGALEVWSADADAPSASAEPDVFAEPPEPDAASNKIEVLMEVELPVSISFGRTQLRMRDVLKLISGSIIELDRSISEPVDVVINNCIIARGEVVVVDGYYGVRIQEVMSRRERLKHSHNLLFPSAPPR